MDREGRTPFLGMKRDYEINENDEINESYGIFTSISSFRLFRNLSSFLDRDFSRTYNRESVGYRGRGGIGRRAGLKNLCPQGRVGSIPTIPTELFS